MNDFSLLEKLKILVSLIDSSPLFLFCSMLGIAVLIFFIICIKQDIKVNKWIFISIWIIILVMLVINYNSVILNLIDNLFDSIFMALYFPNLSVYIIVLSVSNLFFIYSMFSKKIKKTHKILNIINALIINIFLILVVDIVNKNNIDIYETLTVYSNSNLLILLELSTAVFTSWILLNLLISAHSKLKKYDKIDYPEMPEIVFDDNKIL